MKNRGIYDFAIIGGDKRMAYLGVILRESGYRVLAYGICGAGICSDMDEAVSLKAAMMQSETIICPIPLSRDGAGIMSGVEKDDLHIEELKRYLNGSHHLFAGCIPKELVEYGTEKNIVMHDYMEQEELTVYNTIATAEGAIAEAVTYQPSNLHGSKALVLGFGRCAKTLAYKLQGLSAEVTVCARKSVVLEEAAVSGFRTINFRQLKDFAGEFEYLFNTVPAMVLTADVLREVDQNALIIDIASAPGGTDFEAAEKVGVRAKLSLGLPGIYAPKASGEALARMTLNILRSADYGIKR